MVDLRKQKRQTKKGMMLEALENSLGIVSSAVKKAGIVRSTHYKWIHNDKKYAAKVQEIAEYTIDFVEDKLLNKIEGEDTTAIIFYLKTKGKGRGYIERVENINRNVDEFEDMTDSEIKKEIEDYEQSARKREERDSQEA